MRFPLLLVVLVVLLALSALRVHGQDNPIHHCIDAEGHALFTDRICADMHATPAPSTSGRGPAAFQAAVAAAVTPPALCAATADELRQEVADAFAAHDANRLAGLILWDGYSERTAVASIRSLSGLMQRPLVDVTTESGRARDDGVETSSDMESTSASASSNDPESAPRLIVQMASGDGGGPAQQTRFDLTRQSGCLWLLPPG